MRAINNYLIIVFLIFGIFLAGCKEDDSNPIEPLPPVEEPDVEPGIVDWAEGFPLISTSYKSLNIRTKITEPGKVYYVLSGKALNDISGPEIKRLALLAEEEKDTDDDVVGGVLDFTTQNAGDTVSLTLNGFLSGENVFSYYIAEGVIGDSTYLMPDEKIIVNTSLVKSREQETQYFSEKRGKDIAYLFYALEDYYLNPFENYPLLIFLHGKGEYSKNGNLSIYKNGTIPDLIHEGEDFPFVIAAPQIDTGRWDTDFVDEFIDFIIATYRIDQSRIYMTGNSLGGVGTWEYAGDYPDRLAAMVPISGHGDTLEVCNMKDIPIWAFHNVVDKIVDTRGSIDMVEGINKCSPSGKHAPMLTIYPEEGHDAWIRTYNGSAGHDIYSWMLGFRKDS